MDETLLHWVEEVTGGRVLHASRSPAGGSRETYLVDVDSDGALQTLVLRAEAGSAFSGTEMSIAREAAVYRALQGTTVPVPRVLGVAPGGAALLMERLLGTADLASVPLDERPPVLESFFQAIGALHNLDVDRLDLPGFCRPHTPEEHATIDLGRWSALASGITGLDPLISYAGAFLLAHPPTTVARTVLLQGDTGPGNFMAHAGRLTGLVDMEFAHIGDPMDDLAWILSRCRGHELGAEEVLRRYSEHTGIPVERASVSYYSVAVQYRCAITTSLAVHRRGGARGLAPYLLVTERFLLALAEELGRLMNVVEPRPVLPEALPTPRTVWYEHLLGGFQSAVAAIRDDDELRQSTRNQKILVHYLSRYDRIGPILDALDREDRSRSLGEVQDEALTDAAAEAGRLGEEGMLRYLVRRAFRRAALWADLLDRRPRRADPAV